MGTAANGGGSFGRKPAGGNGGGGGGGGLMGRRRSSRAEADALAPAADPTGNLPAPPQQPPKKASRERRPVPAAGADRFAG